LDQNLDSIPVNVLLIEDSPSIAMSVKISFDSAKEYEFEFSHSISLTEAIEHISNRDTTVVILDLGLPDSEGLETFFKLHKRFPHLPVVVYSGIDNRECAIEAVRHGAQDYLVKGRATNDDLIKSIQYAIERKQAEMELRLSEEKYRTLLEALPDIAFRIDTDGRITYINQAVRILGYEPDELTGEHFSELVHPEDLGNVSRNSVLSDYLGQKTGSRNAPKLFDPGSR